MLTPLDPRQVGKVLALGKNFRAHAEEFGEEPPEEPLFFNKLPETLVPHDATVEVPGWYAERFDHEAELAVVIGRPGRDIQPQRAFDHVAGYTVANDLTARSLQGRDRKLGHPWFRAKNLARVVPARSLPGAARPPRRRRPGPHLPGATGRRDALGDAPGGTHLGLDQRRAHGAGLALAAHAAQPR